MEDFDNQLIRQKNKIIELIDDNKIEQAKAALEVVTEMWETNSYGYKVKELNERIANKVANLRATQARHKKEMLEASNDVQAMIRLAFEIAKAESNLDLL